MHDNDNNIISNDYYSKLWEPFRIAVYVMCLMGWWFLSVFDFPASNFRALFKSLLKEVMQLL